MGAMGQPAHVYEATADNFGELVLGNSERGLVLVHFWSPQAAPCALLMPRLIRLATEYGGRFLLVLVNVIELGRLARAWSVTSVPTVKFFRHRQVVKTIHGAESEASFRRAIDPLLAGGRDAMALEAQRRNASGDREAAYQALAAKAMDEPDDPRWPLELAKLMLGNGEPQRASALLRTLPPPMRAREEITHLWAHADLIAAAQAAPPVADLEARISADPHDAKAHFQLAACRLVADDYAGALEALLALLAVDRGFNQDAAQRALSAVLALPHLPAPLVADYRGRLAGVLHPQEGRLNENSP